MKNYIKKFFEITLTSALISLQSCDYGTGLYVRNYEKEPVKIYVKYTGYDVNQDSVLYTNSIIKSSKTSLKRLDKSIKFDLLNTNKFTFEMPQNSTVYLDPFGFGFNIDLVVLNGVDTIHFENDQMKFVKFLERKDLFEWRSISVWEKLILNIKLEELKQAINEYNNLEN